MTCNETDCERCQGFYRGVNLAETLLDPDAVGPDGLGVMIAHGPGLDGLRRVRELVKAKTGEDWPLASCVAICIAIALGKLERGEV